MECLDVDRKPAHHFRRNGCTGDRAMTVPDRDGSLPGDNQQHQAQYQRPPVSRPSLICIVAAES